MIDNDTLEFLKSHNGALPRHIAIIMDGNGRWAKSRGLPRTAGHKAGADRLRPIVELCRELGIPALTVYAFSTENWQRPEAEVGAIMKLLDRFIDRETGELLRTRVRLCFPGNPERLSPELREKMRRATEITSENYTCTLNVCVNYGGRDEIIGAIKNMMENEAVADVDEGMLSQYLYTAGLPDPDLVIRTGGDNRISNFLLWQIAYAEIVFHPKFWPEFMPEDLAACIRDFLTHERRFGKIEEKNEKLLSSIASPDDLKKLPEDKLDALAEEIREVVIGRVGLCGGHLASNLGVVELTIALHRAFDSPRDHIIWDVGHQCYPHKLLTGRYGDFASLRTRGGISVFPKREESPHDCFDTGHGNTSVSAALGMAAGRDLTGGDNRVIGVIGDGAMTGGMVFEALNHAGELGSNLIIVLNDNSYSISPVTGAIGRSFSHIRTNATYVNIHQALEQLKEKPSGFFRALSFITAPARAAAKYIAFRKGMVFEEFGFKYVGPIDGHNVREMTRVLEKVKRIKGPVLLHVLTHKGRGYEPAEIDPAAYHGVSRLSCEKDTDEKVDIRPPVTFTQAFGAALERLCEKDERIVGITAAMPSGTGLQKLMEKYPRRFFDVGMAEQHAVTFAAGLAAQGLRPVVAVYSTFLQRAYDQGFHDVCLQNLPVVFAIDRAGLVSKYGQTHQGLMDISYLRNMPNITVMAPRDIIELEAMLEYAFGVDGPVAIRYPAGPDGGAVKAGARPPMERGVAEVLCEGGDAAIWALGPLAGNALKAARILKKQDISVKVVNARFAHPIDEKTLQRCYDEGIRRFFTVEEHLLAGGFGSAFMETANTLGLDIPPVVRIGVPHTMIAYDGRAALIEEFGLTCDAIADRVAQTLIKKAEPRMNTDGHG